MSIAGNLRRSNDVQNYGCCLLEDVWENVLLMQRIILENGMGWAWWSLSSSFCVLALQAIVVLESLSF